MNTPLILTLTPFLPHEHIEHAGGSYLWAQLTSLRRSCTIVFVAPATAENISAATELRLLGHEVILLPTWSSEDRRLLRIATTLYKAIRGVAFDPLFDFSLRKSHIVRDYAVRAHVIDFQWAQSAQKSRYFRRIAPDARQVLTAHDVLTQRWTRAALVSRDWPTRLFYHLRTITARQMERKVFSIVDSVVVFSQKDGALVSHVAARARPAVVHPPRETDRMPKSREDFTRILTSRARSSDRPIVLFTGAMGRPENAEAAQSLIEIWPRVRAASPGARLVLAGGSPSNSLKQAALMDTSIEVTGFVPSLDDYYVQAHLFVAPLRRGAGVKFKVLDAVLWGIPVITTDVGAEGISDEGRQPMRIANNEEDLVRAIRQMLRDPQSNVGDLDLWLETRSRHSRAEFDSRLREVYFPGR